MQSSRWDAGAETPGAGDVSTVSPGANYFSVKRVLSVKYRMAVHWAMGLSTVNKLTQSQTPPCLGF